MRAPPDRGLSTEQAAQRLERDGPNILPAPTRVKWWRELLAQFTHFFALLLWAAGLLAFVAHSPQLGVAIFIVIVVNGLFAFVQERRADRAAEALKVLIPRRATVIRDGRRMTVSADELVVDDLVALDAGDRVGADMEVVESHSLRIDMSTMTGESEPVPVEQAGLAFAGTHVTDGEALAVVVATGSNTRLAGIATLTRSRHRPVTPLTRELRHVVVVLARVAVATGVAFFALSWLLGTDPSDGFLFAVGVTVALVPEGLLPTVTLSLAIAAQRMASEHALVRRLESVETLGSTTFICTDKTGTLTRNQMEVLELWTPSGTVSVRGEGYDPTATIHGDQPAIEPARELSRLALRASNGRIVQSEGAWVPEGDPLEAAIDALYHRLGAATDDRWERTQVTRRFAFDPRRKRMSVLAGNRMITKGAPESVLSRCRPDPEAHDVLDRLVGSGLRVIAVATRTVEDPPPDADEAERDLELVGLLGFEDPPRDGVAEALSRCRDAGVKVGMVTGDHPATALAIAREVGLVVEGAPVVVGGDLPASDDELADLLDHDGIVVARVSPEDKLRIAQALQQRGHVVAMTGDGVNDGPALQQADIGVAMGESGTDVAREAADLVLLDDHFATIVTAIAHGRAAFVNLRRFLTYHLTDNVSEVTPFVVWAASGSRIPLALGVLQILSLDIGTDLLPALALGAEKPTEDILDRPPVSGRLIDRGVLTRVFGVLGPTEAAMEMLAFFVAFVAVGWRPGEEFPGGHALLAASGAAFSTVIVCQMANVFACRSTDRSALSIPVRQNPLLPIAVTVEALLLIAFLTIPPVADLLEHAAPPAWAWIPILLGAPVLLTVDTVHKAVRRRRHPATAGPPTPAGAGSTP